MSMLEAALAYASIGWHVFPITRDKVPLSGPGGYHNATTDEMRIRDWWEAYPEANIAIALRPSGLIAVDVDPRNGGDVTFATLERMFGALPRDCHAITPTGGQHVVLRDLPEMRPRGKFDHLGHGKGVDIKCNGYIVVAPSEREGGAYAWASLTAPEVPAIPDAWWPSMYHPEASDDAPSFSVEGWERTVIGPLSMADVTALRAALAALGPRKSGKSTTYRAARLVFHDYGLGIDDGWQYLVEWNAQCGAPHAEHELLRKIDNAASVAGDPAFGQRGCARKSLPAETRIALAGSGITTTTVTTDAASIVATTPTEGQLCLPSLPELPPAVESGTYLGTLAKAIDDVARYTHVVSDEQSERPYFLSASALFGSTDTPPRWLIEGLVIEGGIAVVATEPKSAKTWLATELAIAVATGTKAVGRFDARAGSVAYFYTEDLGDAIKTRVRSLLRGRGIDTTAIARTFHAQPRGRDLNLTKLEDCARIIASVRALAEVGGPVKLLCLDPLRNIHTSEEDKADAMSALFRNLRMIGTLLDCTILLVHHSAKPSENSKGRRPGQRMRGSGAIHGFVDSGIYLEGLKTPDPSTFTNTVKSEVKAARSAGTFELTLKIEDDPITHTAIKAEWSTGSMGETSATVEQTKSWRALALDIVDAFFMNKTKGGGPSMKQRDAFAAIKGGTDTKRIALALAVSEGWLHQNVRLGSYHITPAGEAISRERNTRPLDESTPTAPGTFGAFAE